MSCCCGRDLSRPPPRYKYFSARFFLLITNPLLRSVFEAVLIADKAITCIKYMCVCVGMGVCVCVCVCVHLLP